LSEQQNTFAPIVAATMDPRHKKLLIAVAVLVIGLWCATPFVVGAFYEKGVDRGTFGDLFGSVNALFSGLALLGVIAAIMLQQKELNLSTKELRNSARALTKQVELSADAARIQVLPQLIEFQKMRVETVGGHDFETFSQHHVTVTSLQDRITLLRSKAAILHDEIQTIDADGLLRSESSFEMRRIDVLALSLEQARAVIPELELLAAYMNDLSSLYKKISETKLDNDPG
jgi:hypothetical protein